MVGIIIPVAAVIFAIGIIVILRKRKSSPKKKDDLIVPISDPDEIRALKKGFASKPKRKLTNSQLLKMAQGEPVEEDQPRPVLTPVQGEVKESAARAPQPKPEPEKEGKPRDEGRNSKSQESISENLKAAKWQKTQDTIERLENANRRLKEALEREVSHKDVVVLNAKEKGQLDKAQEETAASKEAINTLDTESQDLKKQIEEERARFEGLEKKFSVFKSEFEHQKSTEWAKEEALQSQIIKLREENEKLSGMKDLLESKKAELDSLSRYKQENEGELKRLQGELQALKESHQTLAAQNKDAQEQADKHKEDLNVIKLTYEQKLSDATDRVLSLQKANEASQENGLSEPEKNTLEKVREQNEELLASNNLLNEELSKLKEMNKQIHEKEKLLQYELTKSRAQSIGLEKICEDFKEQIESMGEAVNES